MLAVECRRPLESAYRFTQKRIGKGTSGEVSLGEEVGGKKRKVAIKSISPTPGLDQARQAARETKFMLHLKHENIVAHIETCSDAKTTHVVMEQMQHDLWGIIECKWNTQLSRAQIKTYMLQITNGLAYCHSMGVIHLDLKPANILISYEGVAKISDFGISRMYDPKDPGPFTTDVVTSWYRPPEIWLGAQRYAFEVDMWSLGCLWVEMLQLGPLFPGESADRDTQLKLIWDLCGTPNEQTWPGVVMLPHYKRPSTVIQRDLNAKLRTENRLAKRVSYFTPQVVEALDGLLALNPASRTTCEQFLRHAYFTQEYPPPCRPEFMPKYPGSYFGATVMREKAKK